MRYFLTILFTFLCLTAKPWGKTGHRVVGEIAQKNLSKKAQKAINDILKGESLAMVANYMDFIRANKKYDHMGPWHYCTIPDGQSYAQTGTPDEGDVIVTINRLVNELKSKKFTDGDEAFALKCLVHLIGDIHQPLHVGNGEDRGGNDVKVNFFWEESNLHRVWDSGMIDNQQLSYTEWTNWLTSAVQVKNQNDLDALSWANESYNLRRQVYNIPDDKKLRYDYVYKNIQAVKERLLLAGLRLAGVLNQIYQ